MDETPSNSEMEKVIKSKGKGKEEEKKKMTIEEYYKEEYNIKLNPKQKLLKCVMTSNGRSGREVKIPMELAFLTGLFE